MTVHHGLGSDAPSEAGDRTGQHTQDLVSEIPLPLLTREQVEQALTQQEKACQLDQRLYDSDDKQLCIHVRLRGKDGVPDLALAESSSGCFLPGTYHVHKGEPPRVL